MNSFFRELKQRRVVRVAIGYAIAAWLIIQIGSTVLPTFHVPEWVLQALIVVVALGFPAALVLAWAFDVTPAGIEKATASNASDAAKNRRNGWLLGGAGLLVAVAAIGGYWLWHSSKRTAAMPSELSMQRATANFEPAKTIPDKSIAVLPFENLSDDKQNSYFTDGVQDEILTDLAKVADLKVISRTSVMRYKSTGDRDLRQIGQQLGVAHVVEGSVQRSANRVRVNAQLIDARTDAHLWAQTFDRDLADVFAIQSEIAKAIADQLQAKISPREKAAMSQPPTTDLEANRLFLQAKDLEEVNTADPQGKQNLLRAEQLLDEAVARDPKFLVARCLLLTVHMDLYWGGFDHTQARFDLAKAALDNASRLQPDAGEVHLARADYLYHGFRDYDAARAELELARRTLPNSAQIPYFTAVMDRRQGRWIEAEHNFARTLELDPRNVGVLSDTADFYRALRRYSESSAYYERVLTISPHQHSFRTQIAQNAFFGRADLQSWRTQLATLLREEPDAAGDIVYDLFWCALAERDSAAIARAVAAIPPDGLPDQRMNSFWPREWYAGLADRVLGNTTGAQAAFAAARVVVEKTLHDQPDYAPAWRQLALIDAGLGRKDDAIREGRRACELLPLSRDALDGPAFIINLAMVYAWTGEKDLALEQLGITAQIPNGITHGELKLYPQWDPLRGDPRFEQIVASLAPKETEK